MLTKGFGGKGFAVGRLKRHNFCPASALRNRCCIDTKRCLCGIWSKIWRALGTKKNTKVTLRYGTGVALTLSAVCVEFEAKFGELGAPRKHKSHTNSAGRKFALLEGLSHDLVCTGSIYHVHFAWQVWHGQLSPRFKFNKLKGFSGVEIDQKHVDKRILGGKGFAVGRLKRHNFCPASALRNRCCIDTKRCLCGIWSKIWRALGTKKNTKVTLRYGTGVALTLSAVCVEFEAKFGELGAPRKTQKSHFSRKKVCASWRFESWLGLYRIDLSCPFCLAGVAWSVITPF